jgi:acyl-CoA dehydrogenase
VNLSPQIGEERRLAEDTVERWLGANFDLKKVNALVADETGPCHPPEVWRAAKELGWLATRIPEQHGGLGLGLADAAGLVQALGRGVTPGPYLATIIAAEAILLAGSPAQHARALPAIAAGESIASLAGTDLAAPAVEAQGERLSGECGAVAFAQLAQQLVVPVKEPGGTALWLLEAQDDGVALTPCASIDGTCRTAFVRLSKARGERLENGTAAWPRVAAHGALLVAADLLGLASRALEITIDYVKLRRQFDRPIGANQGVKHPLADVYVALSMGRKGLDYAAQRLDADAPDASIAASVAKAKASDAGRDAAAAMIQFHGAIGFTAPHPAHLFFKRAKRQEYEFGDSAYHRERVADHWINRRRKIG